MGVLLSARLDVLPGEGGTFLVVTAQLLISAVSEAAEDMLRTEQDLLGSSLTESLASTDGGMDLARTVTRAALRSREPAVLGVRVLGGGTRRIKSGSAAATAQAHAMLVARVSACGPPRAALVTLEPSALRTR